MNEPANLDELMGCEGEMFVQAAYLSILKRKVDTQGLRFYLNRLNSGVGKLQIVREIAESEEGSRAASELQGLQRALRLQRLLSLPLLGSLIAMILNREGNSRALVRLRALEQKMFGVEREMASARQSVETNSVQLDALEARHLQLERELREEASQRFKELTSQYEVLEVRNSQREKELLEQVSLRIQELQSQHDLLSVRHSEMNEELREDVVRRFEELVLHLEESKVRHAEIERKFFEQVKSRQALFETEQLEEVSRRFEEMKSHHQKSEEQHFAETSRKFDELKSQIELFKMQHLNASRENAAKIEANTSSMELAIGELRDFIENSLRGFSGELDLVRERQETSYESYQAQLLETSKSSQMNLARLESQIASVKSRLKMT